MTHPPQSLVPAPMLPAYEAVPLPSKRCTCPASAALPIQGCPCPASAVPAHSVSYLPIKCCACHLFRAHPSTNTHTSSASGSTTTDAVLVCTRPSRSVEGTRCTRCTPASCRNRLKAPPPVTAALANFRPPASALDCSSSCSEAGGVQPVRWSDLDQGSQLKGRQPQRWIAPATTVW